MSHSRQRKDKVCLNCEVAIYGRYCHICGQENVEPKETLWSLVTHFLYDITHFDGKFFSTVKYLLLRPGFLSKEYVKGRRGSYLHPIKMYVFTSAMFFIFFYSVYSLELPELKAPSPAIGDTIKRALEEGEMKALKAAKTSRDSENIVRTFRKFNIDAKGVKGNTSSGGVRRTFTVEETKYETLEAYDSAQMRLPEGERDGWYQRMKTRKLIDFNQKVNENPEAFFKALWDKFLHKFPQLLFVSLPIVAFWLKLLYVRRKQFYYADHGIFTVHLYIFTFISLFIFLVLNNIQNATDWRWIGLFELAIVLYMIFYAVMAMKIFYQQGWLKTFLKFGLLNILSVLMMIFLFGVFFILSIYEI